MSPFDCRVEEAADPPNDEVRVIVQPIPGKTSAKAYIRGHQYEQVSPWVEYIKKARKTSIIKDLTTPLYHSAHILIKDLQSQGGSYLHVGKMPTWDIHCCNTYQVDTNDKFKYNAY